MDRENAAHAAAAADADVVPMSLAGTQARRWFKATIAEGKRAGDDLGRQMRVPQDLERNILAASHADLVQECVANLPDDILRCIFVELVSDGEAQAPFAIAAVCAKWRRVALHFPSMWSTIYITSGRFKDTDHRLRVLASDSLRVQILLSRSRSAPLDIRIPTEIRVPGIQRLALLRRLFEDVGAHVSRWRTASLGLFMEPAPFGSADPPRVAASLLDFLKGPTPLLVALDIRGCSSGVQRPRQSGYLPFAPRLQHLKLGRGMGCSTVHGFPALKSLTFLYRTCTETEVFEYLRLSHQSLQKLSVDSNIDSGPPATMHLPNLRFLSVATFSTALLSGLRTPMLEHLDFMNSVDNNDALLRLPFLDEVSRTVKRLTLTQQLTAQSLSILARLADLEQLDFRPYGSSYLQGPSSFRDDAVELLTSSHPPIWPRLARIKNLTFCTDTNTDNDSSPHKFVEFVSTRNLPTTQRNEFDATQVQCKLKEVDFDGNAPHSLVEEVKRLLAL